MKKRTLRSVAVVLLATMALTACGQSSAPASTATGDATAETTEAASTGETEGGETAQAVSAAWGVVEGTENDEYPAYNLGSMEAVTGGLEGGEVGYDVYAGEEGKDYSDPKNYTFNDYLSSTTTLNWCPLSWETNEDSSILDYVTMGFYGFNLNSTKDGWAISCELAAALPEDVTADYVGKYGIEEGDTGKAWKIALNPDACWEDGTPINADTYIYSAQQLLDPKQLNRRADSYYAGEFEIVGAKEYFYAGKTSFNALGQDVQEYLDNGGSEDELYVDAVNFWNAAGYKNEAGEEVPSYGLSITDETVYNNEAGDDPCSGKDLYAMLGPGCEYQANSADYVGTVVKYDENMPWDEVGFQKTGDYELTLITKQAIENANYYAPYNLSSTYLVYEPMYEKLKTFTNDVFSTTYGTSVDTTMSYGPYRLEYFESDKQITLNRNENYFAYKDDKHKGQYQVDVINYEILKDHATQLLAFEAGEIDGLGLQQSDMEKYGSSDYIRYTPQSYTTKLTFNTDAEALKERGSQVLNNRFFRQAFSLAIDRTTFAQSYTAAAMPGYGLLNYMYIYDPFTAAIYRESDPAKEALCNLYGLTYGEGGDFDDLDEAYDAITGYDMTKAQELMQKAYDQVTADGSYDGTSEIKLQISVYNSDDIYNQMFSYLESALKAACEGTDFEGKVSMTMVADADYYNTMESGGTDIIFSTWGGAAYQPFTIMMNCYVDGGTKDSPNQMEYGFDSAAVKCTININGVDYTDTLQNWCFYMGDAAEIKAADGTVLGKFGEMDAATRCAFLARMEYAYLDNYVVTPMYYRNSGSLYSQKGQFAVDTYQDLVGFGGLNFYTFNYDDDEWAEAVKNGLTY